MSAFLAVALFGAIVLTMELMEIAAKRREDDMAKDETIELTLTEHGRTERAIFVSDTGDDDDAVWLPLSRVEVYEVRAAPDTVVVTLPEWLAVEKGLV